VIVLAMGLENAVFQIEGGAGLGLTYVTGALVKVGQLAALALRGAGAERDRGRDRAPVERFQAKWRPVRVKKTRQTKH
jgi:uncharacterized membrane protein YoaK (UPF0700 family)